MAFRFAAGALNSGPSKVGANAKARRIVYALGNNDGLKAPENEINGAIQVGSTWFISGAVKAENATTSGVATVTKLPKFASGDLQALPATVIGQGAQEVNQEGEDTLQAERATVSGQGKIGRQASGSLQAGIFRTLAYGTVAKRLLTGSGALIVETRATVSGEAQRGSQGTGELQATPAKVVAKTELDRLVLHTAFGALISTRASVNGVSSKWIIGWGDLQAGRATVYGNNFRPSFSEPSRVTFAVEPRPFLKTGVRGSSLIVATKQTLELGRFSYSWTLNADEEFEPVRETPKTTETVEFVFELPDRDRVFHVKPVQEMKPLFNPTDYEVEPYTTTWTPEVKAA